MNVKGNSEEARRLRALFLYNGERSTAYQKVKDGEGHSAGFWGMIHLPDYGVDAEFVEFEQFVSPNVARFLRKYIFRNIYFVHILFFFKFFSYDIIFTSSAFGTQLLHAFLGIKRPIWVMHDFSITGLIGQGVTRKQRLFKWLVERSGGVVTVGREETDKLKVLFPALNNKITYIPFGVDLDFFKPQDVPENGTIFAVGFDPDRDWESLIKAVSGTSLQVVIATRATRLAHLLPLPQNVTQKTFTQKELIDEYARASIVVIPMDTRKGVNDAMGCSTLFEALSMGKAIVATDTHTFASYIETEKNGVLVPERDVLALRSALTRLMNDVELRTHLGAYARRYAEEHLDVRVLTKELALFFKRVTT